MRIQCSWGHIDTVTRTVVGPEGEGGLRELEARLLERLHDSANEVVSRESLLTEVFGYASGAQTRTLDTTVRRLRGTFKKVGADPTAIQTVYGEGYRWIHAAPAHSPIRSTLVGRVEERTAILALLESHALVSILGLGGMGKTSLAKDVLLAHPNGVFVDLAAATDASGVCDAIASGASLHLESDPVREIEHLLETSNTPLWVFDNAEQVVGPLGTLLTRWLEAVPQARILVTSRHHLGVPNEQRYPLSPLAAEDSAELFRRRAAIVAPVREMEARDVEALMGELEHHPLSIELAASRMRIMNLGDLRKRLSQRLKLLARGPSTEPRHQSIRAMVSTSLDLLDDEERSALMQASVLPNGFRLERFVDVVKLEQGWPEDILQSLVEHHLIHVDVHELRETRFRLHGVVRVLVNESADAAQISEARARYVHALVEECRQQELAWWPPLDASPIENLRTALQYPEVLSDPEAQDVLITALCQAWRSETRNPRRLGALLPAPPRLDSPRQAVAHAYVARMENAERALDQAELAVEAAKDSAPALQYDALFQRARCYSSTGQSEEAKRDADTLVRLASAQSPRVRFAALCDQAIVLSFTLDIHQVPAVLAQAEVFEPEGSIADRHWFRAVAVETFGRLGNLTEARRHAKASYLLGKEHGSPHQLDRAALDWGYVLALSDDMAGAKAAMYEILEGIHPTSEWARVRAWSNLILFECNACCWDPARTAMRQGQRLVQTSPSSIVAPLEDALEYVCQVMGDLEQAHTWDRQNASSHEPQSYVSTLAMVHAQAGDLDKAIAVQRGQLAASPLSPTVPAFLIMKSLLGELLLFAGETDEARDLLNEVMHNIGTTKRRLAIIRAAHAVANDQAPDSGYPIRFYDCVIRCWTAFRLHQRGEPVPKSLVSPVIETIREGKLPPTSELAWRLKMAGIDPILSDSHD